MYESEGSLLNYSEEHLTFATDSIFAVQLRTDLENGLSATAQITGRGSQSYEAEFEWAFLSQFSVAGDLPLLESLSKPGGPDKSSSMLSS